MHICVFHISNVHGEFTFVPVWSHACRRMYSSNPTPMFADSSVWESKEHLQCIPLRCIARGCQSYIWELKPRCQNLICDALNVYSLITLRVSNSLIQANCHDALVWIRLFPAAGHCLHDSVSHNSGLSVLCQAWRSHVLQSGKWWSPTDVICCANP